MGKQLGIPDVLYRHVSRFGQRLALSIYRLRERWRSFFDTLHNRPVRRGKTVLLFGNDNWTIYQQIVSQNLDRGSSFQGSWLGPAVLLCCRWHLLLFSYVCYVILSTQQFPGCASLVQMWRGMGPNLHRLWWRQLKKSN